MGLILLKRKLRHEREDPDLTPKDHSAMPRSSPNTAHTAFSPCPRMAGKPQKHANGKQKILSLAGEEEEGLYGGEGGGNFPATSYLGCLSL